MEGAAPTARAALQRSLKFSQDNWAFYDIEKGEKMLRHFDELAATASFGQPDSLEWSMFTRRLDWEYAPAIRRREAIIRRWQAMLEALVDWVDSFARFAPHDPRWNPPGASPQQVRHNIARTQECGPGNFRFREAVFDRYFQLGWGDIWTHETFRWEFSARRVLWSDQRLDLIRDTYPHCQPGQRPPTELVSRAESLHNRADLRPDRLQAPPWGTPIRGYLDGAPH